MICLDSGSPRMLPGCGSPWKKPSTRTCLMIGPDEDRAELGRVEAGRAELVRLRDLDPVDELHRDDALAGQVVVDERDVDLREARHPVGQAPGVVRLVAVVELLEDALRRTRRRCLEADLAGDREALLGDLGQLLDDAEVGLGLGQDPRALDLDRDERPVVEASPGGPAPSMPPRTARVERGVQLLRRRAELLGDDRRRRRRRRTARPRSGASTARRSSRRQDVAPARHHLADLHVGRPELLEHRPDPLRPGGVDQLVRVAEDDAGRTSDRIGPIGVSARAMSRLVRVDRVVDLLEPKVLDDRVPPRRRQRLEERPRSRGSGRRRGPGD